MTMRFVVLGSAGQLGRDLCARLPGLGNSASAKAHHVVALTRSEADLTQPETLRTALEQARAADETLVVINCAAYNLVDRAEDEPGQAFAVNTLGARALAQLCAEHNWFLVHFSTDYVFGLDASRITPWQETDAPGPTSVYGLSKLGGEYQVRSLCPRHLVIRTCGLYGVWGSGGKGGNFVETMLRIAGQGKPLRVVADQTCTPSYTVDVAEMTIRLLESGQSGLFHVTNSEACTWHELARTIFELEGIEANLTPITTEEFGARAPRPRYSVLDAAGLRAAGLPTLRPWREALQAYLQERRQRKQLPLTL